MNAQNPKLEMARILPFGFPFGSEPQGRRLVLDIHSDFWFRTFGLEVPISRARPQLPVLAGAREDGWVRLPIAKAVVYRPVVGLLRR